MQIYVAAALYKYHHASPQPQLHSSNLWEKTSMEPINKCHANWTHHSYYQRNKTFIKQIVGTLIYYARSVESNMLVALGYISSNQANITEATAQDIVQLLHSSKCHCTAQGKWHGDTHTQ